VTDPNAVSDAWNLRDASLEEVERVIHDGFPLEQLTERANAYVGWLRSRFPWAVPKPGAVVLEIGSGVGYLMQAALEQISPSRIIGLDAAEGMIAHAKDRLVRDNIYDKRIEFLHYNGERIPIPDNTIDFVYSIAVLQHIPRQLVYNLFFEIKRILKPNGYFSGQISAFSGQFSNQLDPKQRVAEFRKQIEGQIRNTPMFGWMTYYSFEELLYILSQGVEVKDLHIVERDGNLWFSFCKDGQHVFHHSWLPELRHGAVRRRLLIGGQADDQDGA